MMSWSALVPLGDLQLTVPAAAAITACLLAARRWRLACWWCALFAGAVLLVGATKIAYLSWGIGMPALRLKALSGHATGAGAMLPMLLATLCCWSGYPRWRAAAFGGGMVAAMLVAAALIITHEHSVAESIGGWLLGVTAAAGAHRLGTAPARAAVKPCPTGRSWPLDAGASHARIVCALAFIAAFAAGVWLMQFAHVGYWMIKAARLLSGQVHLFALDVD